eukprot:191326-Rhodomonas_salina.1
MCLLREQLGVVRSGAVDAESKAVCEARERPGVANARGREELVPASAAHHASSSTRCCISAALRMRSARVGRPLQHGSDVLVQLLVAHRREQRHAVARLLQHLQKSQGHGLGCVLCVRVMDSSCAQAVLHHSVALYRSVSFQKRGYSEAEEAPKKHAKDPARSESTRVVYLGLDLRGKGAEQREVPCDLRYHAPAIRGHIHDLAKSCHAATLALFGFTNLKSNSRSDKHPSNRIALSKPLLNKLPENCSNAQPHARKKVSK